MLTAEKTICCVSSCVWHALKFNIINIDCGSVST